MEYDLDKPETWIVYPPPPCDPGFDRELLAIGGTNPDGEPVLMKRWGATWRSKGELVYKIYESEPQIVALEYTDPADGQVKRVTDGTLPPGAVTVPVLESVELGELRWIIERWVSPAELAKQGYFDEALNLDPLCVSPADLALARKELHDRIKSGESAEKALTQVENQLDRMRPLGVDQDIKRYFDPAWRTNGDYQFFFRLERPNGTYHPADGEALEAVRMLWKYNETVSPAEHEANIQAAYERGDLLRDERIDALWSPDNITQYRDTDGTHTLWQGKDGSANVRIDTVI
jgi:hypothetical protein